MKKEFLILPVIAVIALAVWAVVSGLRRTPVGSTAQLERYDAFATIGRAGDSVRLLVSDVQVRLPDKYPYRRELSRVVESSHGWLFALADPHTVIALDQHGDEQWRISTKHRDYDELGSFRQIAIANDTLALIGGRRGRTYLILLDLRSPSGKGPPQFSLRALILPAAPAAFRISGLGRVGGSWSLVGWTSMPEDTFTTFAMRTTDVAGNLSPPLWSGTNRAARNIHDRGAQISISLPYVQPLRYTFTAGLFAVASDDELQLVNSAAEMRQVVLHVDRAEVTRERYLAAVARLEDTERDSAGSELVDSVRVIANRLRSAVPPTHVPAVIGFATVADSMPFVAIHLRGSAGDSSTVQVVDTLGSLRGRVVMPEGMVPQWLSRHGLSGIIVNSKRGMTIVRYRIR